MQVESLYIAPVKSLGLSRLERASVTARGIAGDRAFYMIDAQDRVLTQRDCGALVQIRADYDPVGEHLRLTFPEGVAEDDVRTRDAAGGSFYGTQFRGLVVDGPFGAALSAFAGRDVRLVKAAADALAFDDHPISLCSDASVRRVREAAQYEAVDVRRFRQNIVVSGAGMPHEEDEWIGRNVRVGRASIRVVKRDARCEMTTHDPDTGAYDIDTLGIIASYRTDQPKKVNFGVYCSVAEPGEINVGDAVTPESDAEGAT